MASHAVRSWSASRRGSPNSRVVQPTELATRSSEEYPQGGYRLLQSGIKFLRRYQSSGVRDATLNQWRQTRRKLYESSYSPPKSPSGITFHRKTFPRISGGRRVVTFNREFWVRLCWIMALSCSSICSSNARWNRG